MHNKQQWILGFPSMFYGGHMKSLAVLALLGPFSFLQLGTLGQRNDAQRLQEFTLHIHTDQNTYTSGSVIFVKVDKVNLTRKPINCSISGPPGLWYKMDVQLGGIQTDETKELRELLAAQSGSDGFSKVVSEIADVCKPGKVVHYSVPVSSYYQMKKPGEYKVTFWEERVPHDPDNGVRVKSNTISIIVLPGDEGGQVTK